MISTRCHQVSAGLRRAQGRQSPSIRQPAVLVGMLLSNVTAELAAKLVRTGNEAVPQQMRMPRLARHFDDMEPAPPPPPVVEKTVTGEVAQSDAVPMLLKRAFERQR